MRTLRIIAFFELSLRGIYFNLNWGIKIQGLWRININAWNQWNVRMEASTWKSSALGWQPVDLPYETQRRRAVLQNTYWTVTEQVVLAELWAKVGDGRFPVRAHTIVDVRGHCDDAPRIIIRESTHPHRARRAGADENAVTVAPIPRQQLQI